MTSRKGELRSQLYSMIYSLTKDLYIFISSALILCVNDECLFADGDDDEGEREGEKARLFLKVNYTSV